MCSGFWNLSGRPWKSILFKHDHETYKIWKKSPRISKKHPKRTQKVGWKPSSLRKTWKVKSNEHQCIYNGFSTFHHRISTKFPTRNVMKTHQESNAEIQLPQASEKWAKCSTTCPKEGPEIHKKSMEIQPWLPRCPLCWPWGPLDPQKVDSGCKKWVPRLQNQSPKWENSSLKSLTVLPW